MLKTPEEMNAMTLDLAASVWTASAIAALLESGIIERLSEPTTIDDLAGPCRSLSRGQIAACLAVAATTGMVVADAGRYRLADGAMPLAHPIARASLSGEMRSCLMQGLALCSAARGDGPSVGWRHTDPNLLNAQGDSSAGLPPVLKTRIVPMLDDLGARLEEPGATFLDVGVGVGALAISMCRVFPQVSVVGLDDADAPLAIARQNVVAANLVQRIELRKHRVEALSDEEAFDLVWLPSFFIGDAKAAIHRLHAALRPGGWLICATLPAGGSDRQRAVLSLVNEEWGGSKMPRGDVEAELTRAKFSSVRTLSGPDWAPAMVVGRRA